MEIPLRRHKRHQIIYQAHQRVLTTISLLISALFRRLFVALARKCHQRIETGARATDGGHRDGTIRNATLVGLLLDAYRYVNMTSYGGEKAQIHHVSYNNYSQVIRDFQSIEELRQNIGSRQNERPWGLMCVPCWFFLCVRAIKWQVISHCQVARATYGVAQPGASVNFSTITSFLITLGIRYEMIWLTCPASAIIIHDAHTGARQMLVLVIILVKSIDIS